MGETKKMLQRVGAAVAIVLMAVIGVVVSTGSVGAETPSDVLSSGPYGDKW
jgi:hypothetical protein